MSYFNNPLTEEELKEQYRELLKNIDYHNPQNSKLIEDMHKEYKECNMRIKRANGYRTPLEKVADCARNYARKEKEKSESIKIAKATEKERIEKLKNHVYTKEELVDNFNQVKYYFELIIMELSKNDNSRFTILNAINRLDNAKCYQWLNASARTKMDFIHFDLELQNKFDSAREVLEYAILSISEQTKTSNNENLLKMEDSLGKYFKECYRECCDKYVDPVKMADVICRLQHYNVKPTYTIQEARVTERERYEHANDTTRTIFHSLRLIHKLLGF